MIITISGKPGSGKSTLGESLSKKLNYKIYDAGGIRRRVAHEKGITIDQLNELAKKDSSIVTDVDKYVEKLGKVEDNFIVVGWIAFHFIPKSIKLFLECDPNESAKRVYKNQRPTEEKKSTVLGVKKMLDRRKKEYDLAFKKYYNVDVYDINHYDLIIDTTEMTQEEVLDKVLKYLKTQK